MDFLTNIPHYNEEFPHIADILLNTVNLKINGRLFDIVEIEFYMRNNNHDDHCVHCTEEQLKYGFCYFHKKGKSYRGGTFKGVDLTFGDKINKTYYGVLIRCIRDIETGEYTLGPSKTVDKILEICELQSIIDFPDPDNINFFSEDSPIQLAESRRKNNEIYNGKRIGISRGGYENCNYRYASINKKIKKCTTLEKCHFDSYNYRDKEQIKNIFAEYIKITNVPFEEYFVKSQENEMMFEYKSSLIFNNVKNVGYDEVISKINLDEYDITYKDGSLSAVLIRNESGGSKTSTKIKPSTINPLDKNKNLEFSNAYMIYYEEGCEFYDDCDDIPGEDFFDPVFGKMPECGVLYELKNKKTMEKIYKNTDTFISNVFYKYPLNIDNYEIPDKLFSVLHKYHSIRDLCIKPCLAPYPIFCSESNPSLFDNLMCQDYFPFLSCSYTGGRIEGFILSINVNKLSKNYGIISTFGWGDMGSAQDTVFFTIDTFSKILEKAQYYGCLNIGAIADLISDFSC